MGRFVWAVLCLFTISGGALADTVFLRNGSEIKNVRTRVQPGRIELTDCTSTYSVSDQTVKNIKPGPVTCTAPAEKTEKKKGEGEDRPDHSDPGTKTEKGKETPNVISGETPLFDRPWMLALQGAVPGWSGMFRGDRWGFGFAFVGLELVGISRLLPFIPPPTPAVEELRPTLLLLAAVTPQPPGSPQTGFNMPFFLDTTARLGTLRQVKDPRGGFMSAQAYVQARREAVGALIVISALDIISSVWLNPVTRTSTQTDNSRADDVRFSFGALPSGARSYLAFVQISF